LAFQEVEQLPEEMQRQFQLLDKDTPNPGSRLMQLKRTRLIDGVPAAIEDVYLPLEIFSGIEKYDFSNQSLYETLNNVWGIVPVFSMQVMTAKAASQEEADQLEIPVGKPLLSVFRLNLSEDFRVIEYCESVYNTDKYIFLVRDTREI
jgi:GntR family transcriptional regulator